MDRSWWRVLTRRGLLEKGMVSHFSILALRTPWTEWTGKKDKLKELPRSVKAKSESRSVVSDSLWPHGLYRPWNSPGQNTGVGNLSLLQGIFPTQGSNQGLPHCRRILSQVSHKWSPSILEWVAYPFPSGFSQLRNQTRVSCIAGGFCTNWGIREAPDR